MTIPTLITYSAVLCGLLWGIFVMPKFLQTRIKNSTLEGLISLIQLSYKVGVGFFLGAVTFTIIRIDWYLLMEESGWMSSLPDPYRWTLFIIAVISSVVGCIGIGYFIYICYLVAPHIDEIRCSGAEGEESTVPVL